MEKQRIRRASLWWKIKNLRHMVRGLVQYQLAKHLPNHYIMPVGTVRAVLYRADGEIVDYGLISTRVVTTVWANALVDTLQSSVAAFSNFKYHATGAGTASEAAGDTTLGSEITDVTRPTGSQAEGASANIYKSVGSIGYTDTHAVTEAGLFNATANGTLLDRSVFAAINVISGDTLAITYQLTVTAGS